MASVWMIEVRNALEPKWRHRSGAAHRDRETAERKLNSLTPPRGDEFRVAEYKRVEMPE